MKKPWNDPRGRARVARVVGACLFSYAMVTTIGILVPEATKIHLALLAACIVFGLTLMVF